MDFDKMKLPELKAEAKKLKIKNFSTMRKAQLLAVLKGETPPPVKAPAEEEAPAKAKAPAKKKAPRKKKDFGIIKGIQQGSLGPLPFNLVKEFMLEKKDDYDDLYFDSYMFREFEASGQGPSNKGLAGRAKTAFYNPPYETALYFLEKLDDAMKKVEPPPPKNKKAAKAAISQRFEKAEERAKSMTEDEVKAYYAKFGFDVALKTRRYDNYILPSSKYPKGKKIETIEVYIDGVTEVEDDAKRKIDNYFSKKEGVKAKVAARYKAQYDKEFDVFKDCYETYKRNVAKIPLTFPPEEQKKIVSMVGSGGYYSL